MLVAGPGKTRPSIHVAFTTPSHHQLTTALPVATIECFLNSVGKLCSHHCLQLRFATSDLSLHRPSRCIRCLKSVRNLHQRSYYTHQSSFRATSWCKDLSISVKRKRTKALGCNLQVSSHCLAIGFNQGRRTRSNQEGLHHHVSDSSNQSTSTSLSHRYCATTLG